MRIGHGYDVHRLVEGRRLILGGVEVPFDKGLLAQAPKLAPYLEQMRRNLAWRLQVPVDAVSVKATTEEGLGFTGTGDGIAAHAVCLVENLL